MSVENQDQDPELESQEPAEEEEEILEADLEQEESQEPDVSQRLSELGVDSTLATRIREGDPTALVEALEIRQSAFSRKLNETLPKADAYDALISSPEFQEYVSSRQARQAQASATDEDPFPEKGSEKDQFDWHVRQAVKPFADQTKVLQRELGQIQARETLNHLRTTYSDFRELEPQIKQVMTQRPNLGPEEAYFVAKGMSVDEVVYQKARKGVQKARNAQTITTSRGGSVPKGLKGRSAEEISQMSTTDAWAAATAAALAKEARTSRS